MPRTARILIVPGLHDSGPAHWQTWLEAQHRDALRVVQRDWATPDIERWAGRIGSTIERAGPGPWIAVAHSFGVLALARHLRLQPASPVAATLLVAPADPDCFGVAELLPRDGWPCPGTLVVSDNDPWLPLAAARRWAQRWSLPVLSLGQAGHINAEAGFGPLPLARRWIANTTRRLGLSCCVLDEAA